MGGTACYCALCSGPAESCSIGSTTPGALEWRRKRVARERKLFMEPGQYPSRYGTADYAYDPELVSEESLQWLWTVHCLGCIDKRTVLYEAMKEFCQVYSILELDYGQIEGPEQDWYSVPGEELGRIHKPHHFNPQVSLCGHEDDTSFQYVGTNPLIDATDFLRELVTRDTFKHSPLNHDIRKHAVKDPFDKIPFDKLHNMPWLSGSSICALSMASWAITSGTRYNGFWRKLFAQETDWLWEINDIL
ncbi:hypothetical protein ACJ73_01755 [Blastomyces percursus]|uniref:Uncharacterized protein n=1 Tax=Blastomyces percursus TaxID=1658174 RepID=A0A1J9RGV5_9EURO|nr:hypothetical protein ACJ73_01755 [Blastomyces percursus]